MDKEGVYIGVDVGTQGVRLLMVNDVGEICYEAGRKFKISVELRIRQSPEEWWTLLDELFLEAREELGADFYRTSVFRAIGVTSTSGTIIPLTRKREVLYGAIMYSDPASSGFEAAVRARVKDYYGDEPGFKNFGSSCGLLKMLWFKKEFPDLYEKETDRFVHASDYITGMMTGRYEVTDHSNALKSGYDLHRECWPAYLWQELGLRSSLFPEVRPIGSRLGMLDPKWVRRWGLSQAPEVSAGLTDGCASQFSTGAVRPGDWNTTIGTTLVMKGVTRQAVYDREGSIYCHKHPEGYWLPGGASNTGADWVNDFSAAEVSAGSLTDEDISPGSLFYYPLKMKGERFPFINPEAESAVSREPVSRQELFQAGLEGVAFIERYGFEKIEALTGERVEKVYSAGGGNRNEKWLRIRAGVLGRPVVKAEQAGGALGAALVAASADFEQGLAGAADRLLPTGEIMVPDPDLTALYDVRYRDFIAFLKQNKIIDE